ncbi:dsDNA binding protein [Bacillus phage DLc1]|uniref:Double-strand binding protein n=1 Tax=Bacillus phage DLc1 TaxID=2777318 RepID=A0A7M1RRF3_9CAUD|nr:dsDNA binding protein [Bacillus phage DLc1]QOR56279.1 hypothetical protein [Bacillus phage DLc1]
MAKKITRTITQSHIVVGELQDNQIIEIGSIVEDVKVDEVKALKIIRKAFPERNVLVLEVKIEEGLYEISQDDFVKYGKKVEAPVEEAKESSEEVVA